MNWSWMAGGVALGATVTALGLWASNGSRPATQEARILSASPRLDAADFPREEVVALRLALDHEIEAREQLGLELAALRDRLAHASPGDPAAGTAGRSAGSNQRPFFDRDGLIAAGVAPAE